MGSFSIRWTIKSLAITTEGKKTDVNKTKLVPHDGKVKAVVVSWVLNPCDVF